MPCRVWARSLKASELRWPQLAFGDLRMLGGYALTLAVLGSIDSLLTSLVADNITRTQHNSDRELIGQGSETWVLRCWAACPGLAPRCAPSPTCKPEDARRFRVWCIRWCCWWSPLALVALASVIPMAVLAGILVNVGIEIIDWNFLRRAPGSARATA